MQTFPTVVTEAVGQSGSQAVGQSGSQASVRLPEPSSLPRSNCGGGIYTTRLVCVSSNRQAGVGTFRGNTRAFHSRTVHSKI